MKTQNSTRAAVCQKLEAYYVLKFASETGRAPDEYQNKLWVSYDESKRAYCLRGENLPPNPTLADVYPNGWGLLDYVSPKLARELTGLTVKSESNPKRILSVTIRTKVDECPDTSYLGEYSNKPESDYAIDRKHSLNCPVNAPNKLATAQLDRVIAYLEKQDAENGEDFNYNDSALEELAEVRESFNECDCGEHGDMLRHEYRYFNPNHENYTGDTEENIRKYCLQDYERMESFNRGDWCYIGLIAEVTVSIPSGQSAVESTIDSSVWGIESDSGKDFISETESDLLAECKSQLTALGFSKRAISTAFKTIERKES